MSNYGIFITKWLERLLLCAAISLVLSACTVYRAGGGWEHVNDSPSVSGHSNDDHID